MIKITPSIVIQDQEISETFVCASGPGGQNVNKVATAVQLRFDVQRSPGLPAAVKLRLRQQNAGQMTEGGVLLLRAQRFRSQLQNRQDARQRLASLIRRAARPLKRRKKTRPTIASRERRLEGKRHRSRIKQGRKTLPEGN
ncbi:MAG: alternative ribosome rescue aminoacyl-tRNA hydrolase ArfB [Desulfobacterales bacterium]|nr:alternative ribosome rescue aminoacyl-tRNA hydrolase ArfB [Desulfobacterales bacterium]